MRHTSLCTSDLKYQARLMVDLMTGQTHFHVADCVILKPIMLLLAPRGHDTVTSATAAASLQLPGFCARSSWPDPGPTLKYPEASGGLLHCCAVVPGLTSWKHVGWLELLLLIFAKLLPRAQQTTGTVVVRDPADRHSTQQTTCAAFGLMSVSSSQ
jgi:hypothetical protein